VKPCSKRALSKLPRASALGACALWLSACATVHTDVHTERGPLLGTTQRVQVIPNDSLRAQVETRYPALTVRFQRADTCRTEEVQSYAEQTITEKSAPEAGPAIATGVPMALLGLGLFLARGVFSDAPNTRVIDSGGHYGVSDQRIATTWSIGLLAVGMPALLSGAVQLAQTGSSTETRKVDEVTDQKDVPCHPKPAAGSARLVTQSGVGPAFEAPQGTLTLDAAAVRAHPFETFTLDGAPVTLSDADAAKLDAYQACAQVLPGPLEHGVGALGDDALARAGALAKACDGLPEQPAKELAAAVAAEQAAREASAPRAPAVKSFEEALAAYPPTLTLSADSADLVKLDHPEALVGQAVLLRGFLDEQVSPNIVVVRVGARRVLMLLEPEALWNTHFAMGSRVEAVAVVAGTQRLGDLDAPLLRAVWMRPSFVQLP
jgi:hypothetical protein